MKTFDITTYDTAIQKAIKIFEDELLALQTQKTHKIEQMQQCLYSIQNDTLNLKQIISSSN